MNYFVCDKLCLQYNSSAMGSSTSAFFSGMYTHNAMKFIISCTFLIYTKIWATLDTQMIFPSRVTRCLKYK